MTYTCIISGDITIAYLDGQRVAKFDTEEFLTYVISPKEFAQFERNPDKRHFNIRKLEMGLWGR